MIEPSWRLKGAVRGGWRPGTAGQEYHPNLCHPFCLISACHTCMTVRVTHSYLLARILLLKFLCHLVVHLLGILLDRLFELRVQLLEFRFTRF